MMENLHLENKLNLFVSGHLTPSDIINDPELEAFLTILQRELYFPSTLSNHLHLSPSGLFKALHVSPLAILITDTQTRIEYLNTQCEQLTGYTQEELLGKTPRIFKSGHTPKAVYQDMWQQLTAGKSWSGELLNRRKDGSVYWEWISIAPVQDQEGEIQHYVAIKVDVTRRKLAESELRYQATLLDSLSDAVLSTDLDMNILSWNRAAENLYGWPAAETLGRNWLKLQPNCVFTGTTRDVVFQTVLQKGHWSGRVIQHHALGHELPVFVVLSLVRNAQGSPAGLVIINRDLRQHEALQHALEESEARFRQVADHLEEAIWSIDIESGSFEYMSPALAKMTGLSYQILLETPQYLQNFIHPEDRDTYLECLQSLWQPQEPAAQAQLKAYNATVEYRFQLPDGKEKWFSTRLYRSASEKKIWGITEDITLSKRIQAEMARSEQFAYSILGALPALICVLDRQGTIIATNEAWDCHVTGNQGEGNYLGWNYLTLCETTQYLKREQALAIVAGIRKILSGQASTFAMEYICCADTEQCWFELKASRIHNDPEGRVVVLNQDISSQKRTQEALRRLNEHLEEEVALRTQALNQSLKEQQELNQQLIEANRMKDAFLANMSHELRTPLTGILGMADLLSQQILGPLNPKQIKSLQTLRNSGQHLLELINDILDLSKVAAGKLELHPEWVEVVTTAQELLAMVKTMAEDKNIHLLLKIEPLDLKIWADLRRFKQMLVNLLSNAIKFTPEGGVVSLESQLQKDCIILTVKDTGIGIAEADLGRLFQPFVQIDNGLNRKYTGTGLGLVLIKNLIEAHGGYVQVKSQLGQGSAFSLYFPLEAGTCLSKSNGVNTQAEQNKDPSSTPKPRILLIDDNAINIEVIESFLSHADYQVVSLSSGKEALAWLESELPDLVLMDIQMPEMSGFELIAQIRSYPRAEVANLPVIALTSMAMTGDQERILKQGFDNYLSKPVDFAALSQMIKTLLERTENKKT